MAAAKKLRAEVTRVVRHPDDVATFEFHCPDRFPRFRPGQFLHLALDPYDPSRHWPESRAFTIANGPADRSRLRLTIARKGAFTERILAELKVGQQIWIKAPYGDFVVEEQPGIGSVLVAGGTGVTPFVAYMEGLLERGHCGPVTLHYGARSPALLTYRELAEACAQQLPHFAVRFYVEEGAEGVLVPGRVDLNAVCTHAEGRHIYYLCGPAAMVESFSRQLRKDRGVADHDVRVDEWG
jgi:nitric oxide dioxygenase